MGRFDKAIEAIRREKLILIGKTAEELYDKGMAMINPRTKSVSHLNEAIKILEEYQSMKGRSPKKIKCNCGKDAVFLEEDSGDYRCVCGNRIPRGLANFY